MADGKWSGSVPQCQRTCLNTKKTYSILTGGLLYAVQNYIYSCSEASYCAVQNEIRKNQEAAYMFGFICVDFGYREIQFIGLCERLGSGMLFTAEGKMLIHSN